MALLTFNKRLGWVVAISVFWSLISLTIAVGMAPGNNLGVGSPFRLSMGLAQNSIIADGQVVSVIETEEMLTITIHQHPGGKQQAHRPGGEVIAELPDNLALVFSSERPHRNTPPEISLPGSTKHARELAPGHWAMVSTNYAIKFSPNHLRLIPKPPDAKPGWWRSFFKKEPRNPGNPPPGRNPPPPSNEMRPSERGNSGKGQQMDKGQRGDENVNGKQRRTPPQPPRREKSPPPLSGE